MKTKLNGEERKILKAYEKGELKGVKNLKTKKRKHKAYAKSSLATLNHNSSNRNGFFKGR